MLAVTNPSVRRTCLILALAVTACSNDTLGIERKIGEGNTYITVENDGTVALMALRIRTSEQDTLPLISSLAAGGTAAGVYAVRTLHSAPLVRATVQGREIIANPVEGFAGFNPALPEGGYFIRIRATPDNSMLDIRVAPAAP